ncbi:Putative type II secretion system protein D precursor [Stieleria maiorica]|uniref:Type II secretion system protein D n=1 Tax=Stieleria maiorica TaxID=2795974 RepID=A0A5B9MPL4_9BACT|nr:secretin N-terminal domain-containing protein [Stieleria maiorica]QEG02844.1 Putative type II secretion system protein D precursor [Stieleria maiorica]
MIASNTFRRCTLPLAVGMAIVLAGTRPAPGQVAGGDEIVELNLSGTVRVTTLLDLMSKQLGIRFLHGADIARRDVTVYTPAKLPKNVLPTLLGSLLREANLAVVDSEVPGWKRVVDIADIVSSAPAGDATEISRRNGPAAAVTQVLPIKHIDVTTASTSLKPFLSKTGSNIVALGDQGILIVTGYAADVRLVAELLAMIDRPDAEGTIEFYLTRRRPPSMLIEQFQSIRQADGTQKTGSDKEPKLLVDPTGRRVVVAGRTDLVTAAIALLERLDSGTEYLTRIYRLEYVGASRLDNLIRGFAESPNQDTRQSPSKSIETTIDEEGNLLVVRAGADVHHQIETLLKELDQPVDSEESPIRFYKLKNATAMEVLYSLLALQEAAGSGVAQAGGLGAGAFGTLGGMNMGGVSPAMGMGANPMNMMQGGRSRAQQRLDELGGGSFGVAGQNLSNNLTSSRVPNQNAALGSVAGFGASGIGAGGMGMGGYGMGAGAAVATLPGNARVSADVATNSLIVFAPSNVQSLYEKLIRSLDQRRPQVLIQADIIAIDTSDNFSLGVEISGGDREGSKRLFEFTSFGLSEVDPTDGSLTINPSLGFNGVLVDPEVADVIVQALSRHTRGRVLSSPKVLVNDNQTGTLNSISSIPFQAFSQGETTTLTGLGGNQEAGTTIQVTPHINEDDHLQLEFDVEFSTFIGTAGDNLPPPRQIDRVGSVVTIPDGKTIVVGGLKRTLDGTSFTGVPWLEKIPVIRELTSLRSEEQTTTSFFLFIRPRILRDSQFRDLQFLSDLETQDAQLPADYPVSKPLLVPCPAPAGFDPVESEHLLPPMQNSDPMGSYESMDGYEVIGEPQVVYPSP